MAINYYSAMDSDSVRSTSTECTRYIPVAFGDHEIISKGVERHKEEDNKTGVEGKSDEK